MIEYLDYVIEFHLSSFKQADKSAFVCVVKRWSSYANRASHYGWADSPDKSVSVPLFIKFSLIKFT